MSVLDPAELQFIDNRLTLRTPFDLEAVGPAISIAIPVATHDT